MIRTSYAFCDILETLIIYFLEICPQNKENVKLTHIVNGDVSSSGGAPSSELLENHGAMQSSQGRAAVFLAAINRAKPNLACLSYHIHGQVFLKWNL